MSDFNSTDRNKFDLDFSEIHEIIKPGEIREYDRVLARVRLRNQKEKHFNSYRVWKLSPLGVELVSQAADNTKTLLSKGDPIDLEIIISGQRMSFEGLVVDVVRENKHINLVGIRLSKRTIPKSSEDRRITPRWLCSDYYFPTAISPSPFQIHDFAYFQVKDLSRKGMQLICSLRNKYILPEMRLKLTINFPTIGDVTTMVKVVRVGFATSRGKDMLAVGVEFLENSQHLDSTIAQYLIQFSNAESLVELQEYELAPTSLTKAIHFYFIKSESDYREVLNLRRIAHEADGNFAINQISNDDMGDLNDSKARILVGVYKGKFVTTARIRFNTLDEPLEHEKHVSWPHELPRRDQIVEISRAANHPDFRHGDLLVGLFQFLAATCVRYEKPFFVIGSWPNMVDFYKKIGFKETGLLHGEDLWKSSQHVMIANGIESMLGKRVHPIYWNLTWRAVAESMIENSILEPKGLDKIRLACYRLLGPIARLATIIKRRPRKINNQ